MRLIDADALTKQLEEMADNEWNKSVGSSKGLEDAIDVVESMPTIKTFTLADIEEQYRKGLEKGLEETIRCAICENSMKSERGCDGSCRYDEKLFERIVQAIKDNEVQRPHGEWVKTDNRWGVGTWRCTHCGSFYEIATKFCPYCGASMKEGDEK